MDTWIYMADRWQTLIGTDDEQPTLIGTDDQQTLIDTDKDRRPSQPTLAQKKTYSASSYVYEHR